MNALLMSASVLKHTCGMQRIRASFVLDVWHVHISIHRHLSYASWHQYALERNVGEHMPALSNCKTKALFENTFAAHTRWCFQMLLFPSNILRDDRCKQRCQEINRFDELKSVSKTKLE